MAVKKIDGYIKLQVAAGQANPAPPIGTALGPKGVNIADFCKKFNDTTAKKEKGVPLPVIITVYTDRSFDFIVKAPPVSYLLKKYAGIKKGSTETKRTQIGEIKEEDIWKIVEEKKIDMNCYSDEAAFSMIVGTAISMGLNIAVKK